MRLKVTVTEETSGEVLEERTIEDDYVLVTAGDYYLAHTQADLETGTHVVTVARHSCQDRTAFDQPLPGPHHFDPDL